MARPSVFAQSDNYLLSPVGGGSKAYFITSYAYEGTRLIPPEQVPALDRDIPAFRNCVVVATAYIEFLNCVVGGAGACDFVPAR